MKNTNDFIELDLEKEKIEIDILLTRLNFIPTYTLMKFVRERQHLIYVN